MNENTSCVEFLKNTPSARICYMGDTLRNGHMYVKMTFEYDENAGEKSWLFGLITVEKTNSMRVDFHLTQDEVKQLIDYTNERGRIRATHDYVSESYNNGGE